MTVRLQLFGSPAIEDGGASFVLPFERRSQLLAYLARKRGFVGRAELAALLWPDQPAKLAYANLRKTLFRLQTWPFARALETQGGAVRFAVETDVDAFESALRDRRIAEALADYRGEFLAGFDDAANEAWSSWLGFERERLRTTWRGAAIDRLGAEIEPAEGIALSERLLDVDPLDESALRAHMSWLARDGQNARAHEAYRLFKTRLADELGLVPGSELQALDDSLDAPVSRRPTPSMPSADGFVGRAVELRRIAALLAQRDCRLITILGPGGVGKTRLAQRAAAALGAEFPDGATFVPLEELVSATEIGGRIAQALGLRLRGKDEALHQVIAYLRSRNALLVLDNFEQLASEAAALLETLLDACAQLKLVVTSRVRLALSAEWLLPLEGLPFPEAEDYDRVESFDAVRLFLQAARRVGTDLVPATEAASIVDICRQAEGLPLALELAAAWTRALSCDAIAAELRSGAELLRAADATQPARHASMEVVFEHSWQRLGALERDALARLSVFRGGFTSEAAKAVAGASLPVIGALADKSLLRKGDESRISMHPLVQQLAGLRLGDGEERASTERAHALHLHRLLAHLRRAVEDGERDALATVETEFENCKQAWRWAHAHGAGELLAKSTATLLDFCDHRGRYEEGRGLLHDALQSRAAGAEPELAARLLAAAAHLDYRLDRYPEAEAAANRALATGRDHDTRLQCLKVLGGCYLRLARHDDAKRMFEQALRHAPASTHPHNAAAMLDNLALVEKVVGHYDESLDLSMQSLAQHRRLGDAAGEALCLNNLGDLYLVQNKPDAAGAYLREGLALCDRHGLVATRGLILANLTEVASRAGDDAAATTYAARALETAEASGNRAVMAHVKLQLVHLALRRGDLAAARSHLQNALALASAVGRPSLKLAGVNCFAEVLAKQGESECARFVLTFVAEHPSMPAAERDEARTRLAELPAHTGGSWPGLKLDELVHRIVVETGVAHAPLIATLRSAVAR